jgi:capsular exopolysaccharide synthesis family protein
MADAHNKTPLPAGADRDDDVVERRTLRDYYIILRERLWIALPLAVLIGVGYGYQKMKVTPTYAARATMQFEKPETLVNAQGIIDQAVRSDVDLNTYIEQLRSDRIRGRVIDSLTPEEKNILRRAELKRLPPGTDPNTIQVNLGNVSPVSTRASYIIGIHVTHEDPEAAAIVANKYVSSFMTHLFEKAGGTNDAAIAWLQEQAERLKKESETADQALQRYMLDKKLISLDSSRDMVTDALKKAGSLKEEKRLQLLALDEKIKQVEAFQAEKKSLFEIGEIATHSAIPNLRGSLSKLEQELNLLSERYFEKHPRMIEKSNEIAVLSAELTKAVAQAIAELRTRQAEARQMLATYEDEYARQEKASMQLSEMGIEFNLLKREADVSKNSYNDILRRLNETKTIKNIEKVPVHPLDAAKIDPNPIAPNRPQIIRTSIGIGVLVFLGIAIGLSFIDDRVKSAWDVESFIGANLLGIIPDLAAMKDDEKYTLLLDDKQAPGVEAFLSVYSSIKIHSKLDFPKTILVTSTIPGEGKTLISCNVAGSFARHGKKTLLIDCDLRRPMLHRHFKQQNNAGLIPWFEGGGVLEGDLATSPTLGILKVGENLSLLCSGGRSRTPTELLENPLFGQLLERLKREYDLVIVDSPPLGAVTDSLLIAERIDEVIYVCRFNRAYRKHIRLYMRALRNGKNEILGVVLNGLSPRRIEYYSNYRYYRSYKKYYGAQT